MEARETLSIASWQNVFFAWAVFLTLIYLAALVFALLFHAAPGTGTAWAALFVLLYWFPPIFCRSKRFMRASILCLGIGIIWVVRLAIWAWAAIHAARNPSAQGIIAEAAMWITGIANAAIYLAGAVKVYRAAGLMKSDLRMTNDE